MSISLLIIPRFWPLTFSKIPVRALLRHASLLLWPHFSRQICLFCRITRRSSNHFSFPQFFTVFSTGKSNTFFFPDALTLSIRHVFSNIFQNSADSILLPDAQKYFSSAQGLRLHFLMISRIQCFFCIFNDSVFHKNSTRFTVCNYFVFNKAPSFSVQYYVNPFSLSILGHFILISTYFSYILT